MEKCFALLVAFVVATSLTMSACGGESKASKCKELQELIDQNSETIANAQANPEAASTPFGQEFLSQVRKLKAEIQSEFDSLECG
jgi:hypothetical protein